METFLFIKIAFVDVTAAYTYLCLACVSACQRLRQTRKQTEEQKQTNKHKHVLKVMTEGDRIGLVSL